MPGCFAAAFEPRLQRRGEIASVSSKDGEPVTADIFVDCTGFAGVLIQQALGTPFVSFSNSLFDGAAIAMPTPIGDDIPSQTISTALKHGWRWTIPLTSRYGNGYVYSSAFCSADDAEHELRKGLGMLDSDTPARHLKMKIGRVTKHWNKNCLAVGLAQGFIGLNRPWYKKLSVRTTYSRKLTRATKWKADPKA